MLFGRFEKQNSMTYGYDGHTQRQLKCKNVSQGFLGAPVIKSALQCKGHESDPLSGQIPGAWEQLSIYVN